MDWRVDYRLWPQPGGSFDVFPFVGMLRLGTVRMLAPLDGGRNWIAAVDRPDGGVTVVSKEFRSRREAIEAVLLWHRAHG